MASGATDLEVDAVIMDATEPVPRNSACFIQRIPVVVTTEYPSFEVFKGAGQCVPDQMYVITTSVVNNFFTNAVSAALSRLDPTSVNGQRLREIVDAVKDSQFAGIQYEDLSRHAGIAFDPPAPASLFTLKSWTGEFNGRERTKWAVWDPNQQTWFLQADKRAAWFKMHIYLDLKLPDSELVRLKLSAARAVESRKDLSIRVAWGEQPEPHQIFTPKNVCVVADPGCAAMLFKQASWGSLISAPVSVTQATHASQEPSAFFSPAGVEAEAAEAEAETVEFKRDEQLAITYKIGRKDNAIKLMNATVESVSVVEINSVNNLNATFRRCINPNGVGEVSLRGGQEIPAGVKYITFNVTIPSNIAQHSVLRNICFSKRAHGLEINERSFAISDIFALQQRAPRRDSNLLVPHFGLQCKEPGATERLVMYKNAAVRTGQIFARPARTRRPASRSTRTSSRRTRRARSRASSSPPSRREQRQDALQDW